MANSLNHTAHHTPTRSFGWSVSAPAASSRLFRNMPLVSPRTDTDHFPFQFPHSIKSAAAPNERCRKGGPRPTRCVLPSDAGTKKIHPGAARSGLESANIRRFPCLFSRLFPKNPHTLHNMSGLLRPKSPFAPSKESSSSKADRAVQTASSAERLCWVGNS